MFYFAYDKTNDEVYYDMGQCLPEDMEYVIANKKLSEEFDIASTHMLLVNADLPDSDVRAMIDEMEQVPGVKYVLGMESVAGPHDPHGGAAGFRALHAGEQSVGAAAHQLRV